MRRPFRIPTEFEYDIEEEPPSLETLLVEDEESRTVVGASQQLSEGCQQLLRLLTMEAASTYGEISDATGRPVASLGTTRVRCIDRLESAMEGISSGGDGSSSTEEVGI